MTEDLGVGKESLSIFEREKRSEAHRGVISRNCSFQLDVENPGHRIR